MKSKPFVSVCLATYNRLEHLKNCLDALVNQDYPKHRYEIIVVEDGSHSGAGKYIKKLEAHSQKPVAISYFWQKNQGPAKARNKAISKAKGEIIAFCDDDTIPPDGWISKLVDGFSRHPEVAAVGGIQEEDKDELERNPYARYESWITREFYGAKDKEIKGGFEVPTGGTNNIAYRRDILDKYGVFDSYFGIVAPGVLIAGEDPDLKKRVTDAGEEFLYIPVKVTHKRKFNLKGLAKQSWTRGLGIIHFARKYRDQHLPSRSEVLLQLFKLPFATLKSVITMKDKSLVWPQCIDRFFTIKGQLDYPRVVGKRGVWRFVWLTALFCSVIYAFYYKFYATHVPQGWVWVGGVGGDDSVYLGLMQFVANQPWGHIFGAESPWHMFSDPGSAKILLTPEFSSPYWFYFLGILAKLLRIAPATFMILVRVALGFLLPVSVWVFLSEFLKKRAKRVAFLLYNFAFGLGGLCFLLFSLFKEGRFNLIPFWPFTAMGNAVTYDLFEGVGLHPLDFLGRTYYVASIVMGLIALAALSRAVDRARSTKHRIYWGLFGGLCLAFSQAVYPITGVGFVVLAFLWLVVFKVRELAISYPGIISFFAVGALGGLPWFISLLLDKTHFINYGFLKVNATPWPLLVSTATLLVPSILYAGLKGLGEMKGGRILFWILIFAEAALLSMKIFPFRTVLIYLMGGLLALVSFAAWDRKEKLSLFFWLWFLFAFFASIMPIRDWTPFLPARFMLLIWLPLSVLGGYVFSRIRGSRSGKGAAAVGFILLLALSLPSAFFYSTWFLRKPLKPEVYARAGGDGGESLRPEYIKPQELEALNFLRDCPQGPVLGNYNLGMYMPLLSNKRSLLGRDPMVYKFNEKRGDYEKFFSPGLNVGEAGKIIDKYGLRYIIFGPDERAISNDIVTMKAFADRLELAVSFGEGKEKKVEVWKVK